MSWLLTIVLLLAGLALIIKGGDVFVDAASWMAEKSGIPKFIIGATVVSLATTLPEMLVSFLAAGEGKVDMAIGNAVGSVTANTGLIMGIALVCIPTAIKRQQYFLRSCLMLLGALVLALFGLGGEIGLLPNLLLLAIFALAMWDNIRQARAAVQTQGRLPVDAAHTSAPAGAPADAAAPALQPALPQGGVAAVAVKAKSQVGVNVLKFLLGAAAIVLGAQLLIDNGSALAVLLGIPERIIAVSVVAIGTSLPELVTTLAAVAKKQSALSIGNIIGANIIDLTLILPVCAFISGKPLPISPLVGMVDIPASLVVGAMALVPALVRGKLTRVQGIIMIASYIAYLVLSMGVLPNL